MFYLLTGTLQLQRIKTVLVQLCETPHKSIFESLRIESFATINLHSVSTKLNYSIVFGMQTYKDRIKTMLGAFKLKVLHK